MNIILIVSDTLRRDRLGCYGIGKHTALDPNDGWPLYEEVSHVPLIL